MLYNPDDPEKNEDNDFFDGPDIPEKAPEPPRPVYKPEDPDYWEEEESEWEHLTPRPRRRWRLWLWLTAFAAVAAFAAFCWMRYFNPYVEEAVQYGYVESLEKRGTLFKTYEGVLLPYKELADTTRTYRGDFGFTAADRDVYRTLRRAALTCRPVRVEYRVYHATPPWRGDSRTVVTAADTLVDVTRILPPEYN